MKVLAGKEAGIQDSSGKTVMMQFAGNDEIVSLVFPFEAGFVDRDDRNQTCHAIDNHRDIIKAIRFEKTVGWLLGGNTILEAEIDWWLVSEEDKERIQQNPLWTREIKLAELQQKRYEERRRTGAPMRDGEDMEILARDVDLDDNINNDWEDDDWRPDPD